MYSSVTISRQVLVASLDLKQIALGDRAFMLDNLYKIRTGMSLLVAFLMVTVGALRVSADITTITIDKPDSTSSLAAHPGPYATVTINLTSPTQATVTFTGDSNSQYQYLLGANDAVDLNVNGTYTPPGSISETNLSGFTAATASVGTGDNVDGFGLFNLDISNSDGFTSSATVISFVLKATGTTTWLTASNVLAPNAKGYDVAIKAFACSLPCSSTETNVPAGFASVSPEPASILLFGTGLLTFAGIIRRRRPA
jgi:PEP-CTERM motif